MGKRPNEEKFKKEGGKFLFVVLSKFSVKRAVLMTSFTSKSSVERTFLMTDFVSTS